MSAFTKDQADEMQRRVEANRSVLSQEEVMRRFKAGIPMPLHHIHPNASATVAAKANLAPRKSTQNKSERAYDQHLDALYKQGRIAYHKFEAVTLKLGDDCRFNPDFMVIGPAGEVEFHDVKAKWKSTGKVRVEDDARVKLSVSASTCFPFFTFCTVWLENGTWHKKTY